MMVQAEQAEKTEVVLIGKGQQVLGRSTGEREIRRTCAARSER